MSQENIDIIRKSYDAWNHGDLELMFQAFAPDIEWCLPEGGINAGVYRGHDAVRGLMENYLDAFDYFRMEPERFFEAEGGRIVVFIRSPGKGKGSGIEVEVRTAYTWTMREGKAVRIRTDRAEALKAAGLSEQDAHADSS
jgi:ketosteroid isomerase-like protein